MSFQIDFISLKGSLFSKNLGRKVKFRVLAPPNYRTSEHRFPVLLMNDGQDFKAMKLEDTLFAAYSSAAINPFVYIGIEANEKRAYEYGTVSSADFKGRESLVQIGGKTFSYSDFGVYLNNSQRNPSKKESLNLLVSKKYDAFLNESLIKYQEDHLEEENEDYAHIVSEYRDGLLLFDLMETTIWNASKTDSTEIQVFYDANKNNYMLPQRVDAIVAASAKQKTLKKVSKLLKEDMPIERIKSLVNSNDKVDVIFTSDIMDAKHQALPKNVEFKKGVSKIYKHNDGFVLVKVKEVLPKTQKSFEEAKGAVMSDYQNHKEENWIKDLKSRYRIELNQDVLKAVKSKLKN